MYIESNYGQYLKNKDVIIVGPARYLVGQGLRGFIDSFDIVVRMNHSVPILNFNDYGTRTNIIYNYISNDRFTRRTYIQSLVDAKVDYVTTLHWTETYKSTFQELLRDNKEAKTIKHNVVSTRFFRNIREEMVLAPMTGTVAIRHLLLSKLNTLQVIGFDYYESGYYDGYKDLRGEKAINIEWKKDTHCAKDQLLCIKNINDKRLIIDNVLKREIQKIKE